MSKYIQKSSLRSPLVLPLLAASMASLLLGHFITATAGSSMHIAWSQKWCDVDNAQYGAALLAGVFGGAAKYPRRKVILLILSFFLIASIVMSCATNVWIMLIARLFSGMGSGICCSVVPVYMGEIAPGNKRGFYGGFFQASINFGLWLGILLGWPHSGVPQEDEWSFFYEITGRPIPQTSFDNFWWRMIFALPIVLILLGIWGMFKYDFDTPSYIISTATYKLVSELPASQELSADAIADLVLETECAKEGMDVMIKTHRMAKEEMSLETATSVARGIAIGAQGNQLSVVEVFSKSTKETPYAFITLFACWLGACTQFVGINAISSISFGVFLDAGLDNSTAYLASVLNNCACFFVTVVVITMIDRLGRRSLLIYGSAGMSIFGLIGVLFSNIDSWSPTGVVVGTIGMGLSFGIFGSALWVYIFETMPADMIAVGGTFATLGNWGFCIILMFVINYISTPVTFILFCILNVIVLAVNFVYVKETKGRAFGDSPFCTPLAIGAQ